MLKQTSGRNQRAQGLSRVRKPLQIFVLVALFLWLVHQFGTRKPAPVEGALEEGGDEHVLMSLGRKNLDPRVFAADEEEIEEVVKVEDEIQEKSDLEEQLEDLIDEDDSEN